MSRAFDAINLERRLALPQRHDSDAQCQRFTGQAATDGAEAENPERSALERCQCSEIPLRVMHPDVRQVFGSSENGGQRELGNVFAALPREVLTGGPSNSQPG